MGRQPGCKHARLARPYLPKRDLYEALDVDGCRRDVNSHSYSVPASRPLRHCIAT